MEYFSQLFDQPDQLPDHWYDQEFEQCTFRKLDLSQQVLARSNFTNCQFDTCNLAGCNVKNTKFDDVHFAHCRLSQVDFSFCNTFAFHVDFEECQLDYTVFLGRNLKKTRFVDCSLKEAHFLKCDLTGAVFKHCNLELAKFGENNLTQADFSTSYHLRMNLDDNKVKKAKFSLHNLPGLLTRYDLTIIE
ncbi:uncharacterized protein YjbI with pentapeptide repeats [Spirosoma lacussanchae]|uniref:pentapeptide repeat-containing protein n=1 Tax=Spirosoma lacussanchae TaxID=1884249 RepID=UPI0011097379|nr:pentapeptide repeat-containing protein [Spirosoma lacussanchae]